MRNQIILLILLLTLLLIPSCKDTLEQPVESEQQATTENEAAEADPTKVVGRWMRTDGGYELELRWHQKFNKDLMLRIGANMSYARNEIMFKDEIPQPHDYLFQELRQR